MFEKDINISEESLKRIINQHDEKKLPDSLRVIQAKMKAEALIAKSTANPEKND
ncbi:hypothetical protein KKC94_01995 [Patescibacteria group bacterium]|nr:hypothetical protein [Patescibacteria group bacterium]